MKRIVGCVLSVLICASTSAATNLIPNGGFEQGTAGGPANWNRESGSKGVLIWASDSAESGDRFVKCDSRNIAPGLRPAWILDTPIPVDSTGTYRLDFSFRIDASNLQGGQAVYVAGRYLDSNRKELSWRQFGQISLNTGGMARVTHGWKFRQTTVTVPTECAFVRLSLAPARGFRGVVGVDSLRLVRIHKADLSLPRGAYGFDFTPRDCTPTPGFTGVPADSKYSKTQGYGWELPRSSVARNARNDHTYPDRLDSTGVRRATFVCDLPPGRYMASIYMGGLWRTSVDQMNRLVLLDANEVVSDQRSHDQLMDSEYFRFTSATLVTSDDLARPGYAVWDKYLSRRYRRYDFQFNVGDRPTQLTIRHGYANGLILFPAKMESEYRKTIARFEQQRQREFVETWAELIREPIERTTYVPGGEDESRGCVVFHRHWMRHVQYAARPQPDETDPTLHLMATPCEYEPVTLSIWPLRNLDSVRIEVQPLRSEAGDIVPSAAFRVWYHQQRQERRARPCTAYKITAVYLPDWGTRTLYKNITTRCWIRAKVPDHTPPGIYRGMVRILLGNGRPISVPLELRVLAFNLVRKQVLHTFRRASNAVIVPYPSSYPFPAGNFRNKQFYRAQAIRDLYEHGFVPEYAAWWHGIWQVRDGRLQIDWNRDNAMSGRPGEALRMIKDLAPVVPKSLWVDACAIGHQYIMPAFQGRPKDGITVERIDQWLDALEQKIPSLGFDRLYVAPWGEESHFPPGKGFEAFLAFHRHVRANRSRWPHIRTAHTCNTDWGQQQAIEAVDLAALGMFHGVRSDARRQVAIAQATGRPFGLYGIRGRWVAGFYFWRTGASVTYHEFYAPYYGTPNNDWDNSTGMDQNASQVMNEAPGWCNATYSPDGRMIGTWFWEEMREGVDDHDYMNTLETLIARSTYSDDPVVAAARRTARTVLKTTTDAIKLEIDPSRMEDLVYRPVAVEQFDVLRRQVAEAIEPLYIAMDSSESK